jgi:hypothetical protein
MPVDVVFRHALSYIYQYIDIHVFLCVCYTTQKRRTHVHVALFMVTSWPHPKLTTQLHYTALPYVLHSLTHILTFHNLNLHIRISMDLYSCKPAEM